MKVLNEVKKPDEVAKVRERKRANLPATSSAAEASAASDGTIVQSSIVNESTLKATRREPPIGGCLGGYPHGAQATRAHVRPPAGERARVREAPIESLLDQVAKLTREESQQLLDQLALRAKLGDKKSFDQDLEMWANSVHTELNTRLSSGEAYGVMMVRSSMSEFNNWKAIGDFMKASKLQERTPAQRKSMYMLLAELLVDHAKHEGRKHAHGLTLRNVARCCRDIASIFDWNFPGYLASGLAHVVAEQRQAIASGKTSV